MKNIKLIIQYDGTAYHGWQTQKNAVSVQETVEKALKKLLQEDVRVTGCGRTDTGVHAKRYVCNFFSNSTIPEEKFPDAVNSYLPPDIVCLEAEEADKDFDSRYSAKKKTYSYYINNSKFPNALLKNYTWHFKYNDFIGFAASGFTVKTTVRTVYSLDIEKQGDIIAIHITGDGFLYNMVRIIAGTLAFVGTGKIDAKDMHDIIDSKERKRAGITAPGEGLFLSEVYY